MLFLKINLVVVTGIRKTQYSTFTSSAKNSSFCMKESRGGSEHKPSKQQGAESVGGVGDVS